LPREDLFCWQPCAARAEWSWPGRPEV